MVEQIQTMFFSKENISNLNKILLQQTNKQNIPRELKQEIINILIKNMKIIFKQIDLSKVNSNNINTLFEQFKNHSLRNTINEIQTPSDIKFNRDFNSNPTNGNKIMERPSSTKFNEQNNLDQAFKPIVNTNEQNQFNNYTNGRNKDDIKSLMSDIQQTRTQELNSRNNRPSTPEFLKPKKTSNKEEPIIRTNTNTNTNTNTKLDFKNSTSDQFNIGFQGLSNDISADLFSLDNIDKPLIEEEIIEDNSSFDDRLKRLQSDRGSLSVNNNQGKIDFTSEKFPNSDIGDNSFKKAPIQRQQLEQQEQQERQRQQLEQQERQRQQLVQQEQQERQERQRQQIEQQEMQQKKIKKSINKTNENVNIDNLKNKMKTMNINVNSDNIRIDELEKENKKLKEILDN